MSTYALGLGHTQQAVEITEDRTNSLDRNGGHGVAVAAFAKGRRARDVDDYETWDEAETAPTVTKFDQGDVRTPVLVTGSPRDGYKIGDDAAPSLCKDAASSGGTRNAHDALVLDTYNQNGVDGGVTNTLAKSPTTAVAPAVSSTLKASGKSGGRTNDVEATFVLTDPETGFEVAPGAACAYDPAPDGRRYAACGDGVASPQATWIALRLRPAIIALREVREKRAGNG